MLTSSPLSRRCGPDPVTLRFTELRRWDPDAGTVRTIATPGPLRNDSAKDSA